MSSESILRYVKCLDGLPALRGPLAGAIHSSAISEANRHVLREERGQKHEKYTKYDEVKHAAMGQYACHHQAAAAARYFSRTLGKPVSKYTIKSITKTYTEQV